MKAYSKSTLETFHVHLKTRNASFLKMTLLLQEMGISNCYFHLKLLDKGLKDVDPYDKNLSDEMKIRIIRECADNRWYFYREVFRVSENGAGTGVGGGSPFILNRGNLAYLWAMEMNISTYLIMPRQTGKTWAAIADFTWTHQFCKGSTLLHFNKNQKEANLNLGRIQAAIRMLPMWLQHSNTDNLDGSEKRMVKNNEKTIKNRIDSTIEAMASAGNEEKADQLARGRTSSKIWYDELAFIFFNETIYSAVTPAYEKARELAIKNDAPYAISITTTPGDLATPHGEFAYRMMTNSIPFRENFYDMSRNKLYDRINHTPDKMPFLFIQYSYLQLGETEEWYLYRYKNLNNPLRARREYLLEWMNSNGNSPFDPDDVELIGELSRQRETTSETYKLNKYFDLTVYGEYHGKKPVLIGVDVAGSMGRDSNAVVVVHPETLHPLAIFRSNMIDLNKFRKVIMTIVRKMYPNCILTIERNSVGKGLIDELLDTSIGRVLYREKKKRVIDMGVNAVNRKRTVEGIEYGHLTNQTTRSQMMETLESLVHNSPSHLGYKELYDEIRFLEVKNGRIDHSNATHDDVTMAYMGVLWIVRYGTGLKGKGIYYNISDSEDEFDDFTENAREGLRFVDRLLRGNIDEKSTAEDELVQYMLNDQHTQSSADLYDKEREAYMSEIDRMQGVDKDDAYDLGVSQSTQDLILRGYNHLLNGDLYDNDPVGTIMSTINARDNGYLDNGDWATDYKYD